MKNLPQVKTVNDSFIDKLIAFDKELLVNLNALGSETWDGFWLVITNQFYWIPLFLVLFYLLFKAFGLKKGLLLILLTALFIAFSDQSVNLIKNYFMRLRPCSDPEINETIRIVLKRSSYSFVSGHATTSFAMTAYFILLLKNHFKYIRFLIIWPVLFAYSRVYIGVHFPLDILTGMYLGLIEGFVFFILSSLFLRKIH